MEQQAIPTTSDSAASSAEARDSLSHKDRFLYFFALAWGLAEATLFYIVPDVLLSWIALNRPSQAWIACLWAVGGALIGGSIIYAWGAIDGSSALTVLDYIPDVRGLMDFTVVRQLEEHGLAALFIGPFTGTPYKVYAVWSGIDGYPLITFLLVSIPARLSRFAIVTGLTILICRALRKVPLKVRRILHVVFWLSFYAWFLNR